MPISQDAVTVGSAASDSDSFSHTNNGNYLLAGICGRNNTTPTINTPTYNSVNLTRISNQETDGQIAVEFWELTSPATGANTFSYSHDQASPGPNIHGHVITLNDVDTGTPSDTVQVNNPITSTTTSVSVTSSADDWVVDFVGTRKSANSEAVTGDNTLIGSVTTERFGGSMTRCFGSEADVTGTATMSWSWSTSAADGIQLGVNINASGVPGLGIPLVMHHYKMMKEIG